MCIDSEMLYRDQMRRHYIWYGLGLAWGLAAVLGLLRHRTPQAWPAALFALIFLAAGLWIGRRDERLRQRRQFRIK